VQEFHKKKAKTVQDIRCFVVNGKRFVAFIGSVQRRKRGNSVAKLASKGARASIVKITFRRKGSLAVKAANSS